jgi:hypothetical protein
MSEGRAYEESCTRDIRDRAVISNMFHHFLWTHTNKDQTEEQ